MPTKTTLLAFLIDSGLHSRRRLVNEIRKGRVKVNGTVRDNLRHPLTFPRDKVSLDGRPVGHSDPRFIYIMLNKPGGIVTTTSDEKGRQAVIDFIPEEFRQFRLYPVGRLDKDSSGLILLTNDGNLTYQLTHPKFEYEKEYHVAIAGTLNPGDKRKLETGVALMGKKTAPARIGMVRNSQPYNYTIVIHEGQKRQVRRMFEELGHFVVALKRVRLGNLRIGNLREGQTRQLTRTEIRNLISTQNNS